MTAAHEIFKACDAGFDKCFLDVAPHVAWRRAVKRQIAALRANNDFISREAFVFRQELQRGADGSFTSLEAIVCRCVDDIRARLHCAHHGVGVSGVGFLIRVAEIGADAER